MFRGKNEYNSGEEEPIQAEEPLDYESEIMAVIKERRYQEDRALDENKRRTVYHELLSTNESRIHAVS
jgi:hypothetical protein